MLHISKSQYCSAVQCPKMLWMKKKMPELADNSVMNQAVLDNGNMVGDLAMGLFGDFVEVPFGDLTGMIARTSQLMAEGTPVIAEASFAYEGCFCSVDVLRNLGDNRVELYEVKSSTHVSDIYRHDVAYQTWLLEKLGYRVERSCLVHIDNTYERHGELELSKLFAIEDLTVDTAAMLPGVESRIRELEVYMTRQTEPEMQLGEYCASPYPCPFWKYCSRHLPSPNVFDISGMAMKKKVELCRAGSVSFADILGSGKLNAKYLQQLDFTLNDRAPFVNRKEIIGFLQKLSFPLYFLDFESYQAAIPPFDNVRPYQQIVFQYSLHYLEAADGQLQHREFLADPLGDPRRAVAEQLCRDIPMDVCTMAYNMTFEKTRIRELAELYPELEAHLMNIHDHIVDLIVPFQKRWYYAKEMNGASSIKVVLPALYPDDPQLNYANLEGVHKGDEASAAFAAMAQMPSEERERTRQSLLTYCGLDTFAMVKVWQKLVEAVGE